MLQVSHGGVDMTFMTGNQGPVVPRFAQMQTSEGIMKTISCLLKLVVLASKMSTKGLKGT